jgi:N-methylhydantoinase A
MRLDEEAANRALHAVAPKLGLDDTTFAEGVLAIVNANMADAMRTLTVKQGIDPRDYALVAFGGAGPMHAVWLAEELEFGEVMVPWSPGTFSAWGMLQTDVRHDLVRTFYRPLADVEAAEVADLFSALEREGVELLREQNVDEDDVYFQRAADMRYVGQEYSVSVPIGSEMELEIIDGAFHDGHRVRYGHSTPGAPSEFVNLRVAAFGRIAADAAAFQPEAGEAVVNRRPVVFSGEEHETQALLRSRLEPGARLDGPLVVEEETATTVIPPGHGVEVDELGNLVIARR